MSIAVIVPTYNEKENIETLVKTIFGVLDCKIVVSDGWSTDGTRDIVKNLAKQYKGKIFMSNRKANTGVGQGHRAGYEYVLDNLDSDIIVTMDADLSHNPKEIPKLIEEINNGSDMAIASRHTFKSFYERERKETRRKYFISKYGNVLTAAILRIRINDFTNGFRAFRRGVLENIYLNNNGNAILMEFIAKAYWKGYRIKEVPSVFMDRRYGTSKIKLNRESLSFILSVINVKVRSLL